MQSQQEVYKGEPKLFSGLNILVFIYLMFFSLIISRFIEALSFNQVWLALLPAALAIAWFGRNRVKRNVVKISNESISIEYNGKELASMKWRDLQNAELSINDGKGLDIFDTSGARKIYIPNYIEPFDDLVSSVFNRITSKQQQTSKKQYFQKPNVIPNFIGWASTFLLLFTYYAFLDYQETGSFDAAHSTNIGLVIVASILAIHTIYSAWVKPKQLTFHNDHIEIITTLRNTKIPYVQIANAELMPNPWAPVTSNRNFLRIGRKDKAGGYIVRGFESNGEELLATLQQHIT